MMEIFINSLVLLIFSLCSSEAYVVPTNLTASDVVNRVNFVLANKTFVTTQYDKNAWTPIVSSPIWPKLARHQQKDNTNKVTIDEISHHVRLSNEKKPSAQVTPKNNAVNYRFPNHKMNQFQDKESYKTVEKMTEEVSAKVNEVNRKLFNRRVDTDQNSILGFTTHPYEKRFLNHKMDIPKAQPFLDRPQLSTLFPLKYSTDQYNTTAFHSILANKSKFTQDPSERDDIHSKIDSNVDDASDSSVTDAKQAEFIPLPSQTYIFNAFDHSKSKQIIMQTVKGVTQHFFAAIYEMYYCLRYHWSQGMMHCIASRAAWVFKRRVDDGEGYDIYDERPRFEPNNLFAILSEAVAQSVYEEVKDAAGEDRTMSDTFDDVMAGITGSSDDDYGDDGPGSDRVQVHDETDDEDDDDDQEEEESVQPTKLEVMNVMIDEKGHHNHGHHGHHGQQQQGVIQVQAAPQVIQQPVIQQVPVQQVQHVQQVQQVQPVQQVQLVEYEQPPHHHHHHNGHKKLGHKKKHKIHKIHGHHGHHGLHSIGIIGKKKKKKSFLPLMILAALKLKALFTLLAIVAGKAWFISTISLLVALFGLLLKLTQGGGHRAHGKTNIVFAKPYEDDKGWDKKDDNLDHIYAGMPESIKYDGLDHSYYHNPYGRR